MKRLLAILIVLLFAVPAFGVPPSACPEEVVVVPMDLSEFGGSMTDVLVPAEIGDLRRYGINNLIALTGPGGGMVGHLIIFTTPHIGYPLVGLLIDNEGQPRAIAFVTRAMARTDWMYKDGHPVKCALHEVMAMIEGLPEKPLSQDGFSV